MTKTEIRAELNSAMESFIAAGGSVTVIPTAIRKRKSVCRAKTKVSFSTKAPKPVISSWIGVERAHG